MSRHDQLADDGRVVAGPAGTPPFAAARQMLRLETLYDLLVALNDDRSEQELLDEVLQRACAALDPAAALLWTQEEGNVRALSRVGFDQEDVGERELLSSVIWHETSESRRAVVRRSGRFANREYRELLAVPILHLDRVLGLVVVFDKEVRGGDPSFGDEDERFLASLAALAGVTLDGLRRVESLVAQRERLAEENQLLKEQLVHEVAGQRIVAEAEPMRRALLITERVSPRSVNVLVRGESGTGKELVARMLHERSGRVGQFVAVNCAAVPETLLESELFGIESGVATGVSARIGKFQLAHEGTLFLDEIGDLQLGLQVKLLRALQEREVVRVGGLQARKVDVRLVSATHQSLEAKIAEGSFREDLYFRLKGVEVELPPLRERREDIPHLVRYFAERFARREGLVVPAVERDASRLLLAHRYPGNVRELQALVEAAVALAGEGAIDEELIRTLLPESAGENSRFAELSLGVRPGAREEVLPLREVERRYIAEVLRLHEGNKSAAARQLGVDRKTLVRKGF